MFAQFVGFTLIVLKHTFECLHWIFYECCHFILYKKRFISIIFALFSYIIKSNLWRGRSKVQLWRCHRAWHAQAPFPKVTLFFPREVWCSSTIINNFSYPTIYASPFCFSLRVCFLTHFPFSSMLAFSPEEFTNITLAQKRRLVIK